MTSHTFSGRHRRSPFTAAALMLLVGVVTLVSTVVPAAAADLESVVAALKSTNIYVEDGASPGDLTLIESSVQDAAERGLDLRVAVLAQDDRIDTQQLVEQLGEVTVIVYTPRDWQIESAPGTFDATRFDEIVASADGDLNRSTPAVGVSSFVGRALEGLGDGENLQSQGSSQDTAWWWWPLILLAMLVILGLLFWMFQSGRKSKAQSAERDEFEKRRVTLRDWANNLRQPVTELQQPVAAARSAALAEMYNDALKIARESDADLTKATTLPELDRVEIRVAKAWMQIRDIRKALNLSD